MSQRRSETLMSAKTSHGELRPELLLGPNIFLEALPPPIEFLHIPGRLGRRPLADIDWRATRPSLRETLLETVELHFVATSQLIEIFAGVQTLIRRALLLKDEAHQGGRRRINQISVATTRSDIRRIDKLDGAGLLCGGMTATGKSSIFKRSCEIIAPEQVIDYGNSAVCGWYRLKQCVYLFVDFASNGSRGGLLKRILEELDAALGTDYLHDHRRTTNLDTLLVDVCKLLSLHRVALLVIDEKQQSNFAESPWRIEFVLFYLTLMNLGISVAMAGNPLAFEHLRAFSQVMRRFSIGGIHELAPAILKSDKWWDRDFVPGAREFNLVETWDVDPVERANFERENSGRLPGLYMPLHTEVQRSALRRGGDQAKVTMKDFTAAINSPRFAADRDIALSVWSDEASESTRYMDVPEIRRGSAKHDEDGTRSAPSTPSLQSIEVVKKLVRKFTSDQTRKTNALIAQLEAMKGLDPDDLRTLGVTTDLLAQMEKSISTRRPVAGKPTGKG